MKEQESKKKKRGGVKYHKWTSRKECENIFKTWRGKTGKREKERKKKVRKRKVAINTHTYDKR